MAVNAVVEQSGSNDQLSLEDITKYICPTATEKEAYSFLRLCEAQNLNPFVREVYLIKYGNQAATTVVGKDVFLKRANKVKTYKGFDSGIIVSANGKVEKREGGYYISKQDAIREKSLKEEILLGAWVQVYREDRDRPVRIEVIFAEYVQLNREGVPLASWKKMPSTMIRKVALVQALREAFPEELGGLYDGSEMPVDVGSMSEKTINVPKGELRTKTGPNAAQKKQQPEIKFEDKPQKAPKMEDKNLSLKSDKEQVYQDWEDRIPKGDHSLEIFLVASCKQFYIFMKAEYGYDEKLSKDKAEQMLGLEASTITSMKDVLKDAQMRRDLNIAIWKDKEKVLFS